MIRKLVQHLHGGPLAAAGLGCMAAAAWTEALWAGLLATGAALLLLEWRLDR